MKPIANDEQSQLWNGSAGHAWVEEQAMLDATYLPIEELLAEEAAKHDARDVLDVGCGSGATTLAIARRLGPTARCTGIDISAPLIELANARAAREDLATRFVLADAQTHDFEPGSFDLIVSRFGMMFFDDPVVAFSNLRRSLRKGGGLCSIAFRAASENPFMIAAERAAAPFLPDVPPRRPDAPGQFGLANQDRVQKILADSDWSDIDIAPINVSCAFPEAGLIRYFTRLGPVGLVLRNADEATRERVIGTIRAAFAPFIEGTEVRFVAACWSIRARN